MKEPTSKHGLLTCGLNSKGDKVHGIKLDKYMWVALVLVLLTGTVNAEPAQFANGFTWEPTPRNSKIAYVNGVLVGAYYVGIAYMVENQGKNIPPIDHLIPIGIDAAELVLLIDAVYKEKKNMELPIVSIVIEWRKWIATYGGGI